MIRRLFIISFISASLIQGYWWLTFDIIDGDIWADQAYLVETGNPLQFDPTYAYNPPGGPVIIGTLINHYIFDLSYRSSLVLFLSLFNGLVIASICVLTKLLVKEYFWAFITLVTLSFNRLYLEATPPSVVVTLLLILLFLLSLYIDKTKENIPHKIFFVWSITAGLATATRPEVGALSVIFCLILIFRSVGARKILLLISGSVFSFVLFNPFMWSIPVEHIKDVIEKVLIFHDKGGLSYIPVSLILSASCLAFIGMILAILYTLYGKKESLPFPQKSIMIILIWSASLYFILLTSRYQPIRYFLPSIMFWETLLPLYLLCFMNNIRPDFLKPGVSVVRYQRIYWVIIGLLLIAFQLAIFFVVV